MNIRTDLVVLGDTTLSKLASVGLLKTSGTGLVSTVATIASTDLPMAVDTDQETGTSTTKLVSPGVQKYHPSCSKAWVKCGITGNKIVSYNVASVEDTGTGWITAQIDVDFSTGDWVAVVTVMSTTTILGTNQNISQSSSSVVCKCYNSSHVATDPETYHLLCYGEQ